jgi:CO dehydrogenase/acetyl-CoA synthase alpha subunit
MIKTLELLLGEQFNDPVREGLQHQLRQNKAIYLRELMKQNWDQFCQEFDKMLSDDKNIAMAMVEKMRSEIDALQGSRFYKAVQRIKKGLRIAG